MRDSSKTKETACQKDKPTKGLRNQNLSHSERFFVGIVRNALKKDVSFLMKPGLLEECADICGIDNNICNVIREKALTLDKISR